MASDANAPHISSTPEGRDGIIEAFFNKKIEEQTPISSKNEFNKEIDTLNILRDQHCGIVSKYFSLPVDTLEEKKTTQTIRILHRHAIDQTSQNEKPKEHSFYEGWTIMGLNFMSAAEILIQHYPYTSPKTKDQIEVMFKQFYQEFKSLVPAFIKWMQNKSDFTLAEKLGFFEHKLLQKLGNITGLNKEDIKSFLKLAREFSSFDHEYTAVMTELSINIEPEYQEKWGKKIQIWRMMMPMVSHLNQDWVRSNDPKKKALIAAYKEKMKERPIPTQLRNTLVGARNLCDHRMGIVKDGKPIKWINQFYTSGIPGHLLGNEEDNARATKESLTQIKSLTGAKILHTHSLVNRVGEEKNLDNQVATAARTVNYIVHSNTPFQPYRYFLVNNLNGSNAILSLAEKIKNNALEKIVSEYKRATSWKRFFISSYYSHNHNLHLTSLTQQMAFHIYKKKINDVSKTEEKQAIANELADIVFCKSGKDRTGQAREAMDMYALLLTITGEVYGSDVTVGAPAFQKQTLEILTKFKKSLHVGTHAGMPVGGTIGAFGLLGDISSGKPTHWPSAVEQTARHNKGFAKNPKKNILKGWVVGLVAVAGLLLTLSAAGALLGIFSFLTVAATATTSYVVSGTLLGSVAISTSVIGGVLFGKAFFNKYYHGNHHPPYIDKPGVPFYKNPRFWMVTLTLVASIGLCVTGFGAILGGPLALFSLGAAAAATGIISNAAIVGLTLGLMTFVSGGLLHLKRNHQQKRYLHAKSEFYDLVEAESASKNEFPRAPTNLKINTDLREQPSFVLRTPTPKSSSHTVSNDSPPINETPTSSVVATTPTALTTKTVTMFKKSPGHASMPNLQSLAENNSPKSSRTPSPTLTPTQEEEV